MSNTWRFFFNFISHRTEKKKTKAQRDMKIQSDFECKAFFLCKEKKNDKWFWGENERAKWTVEIGTDTVTKSIVKRCCTTVLWHAMPHNVCKQTNKKCMCIVRENPFYAGSKTPIVIMYEFWIKCMGKMEIPICTQFHVDLYDAGCKAAVVAIFFSPFLFLCFRCRVICRRKEPRERTTF